MINISAYDSDLTALLQGPCHHPRHTCCNMPVCKPCHAKDPILVALKAHHILSHQDTVSAAAVSQQEASAPDLPQVSDVG